MDVDGPGNHGDGTPAQRRTGPPLAGALAAAALMATVQLGGCGTTVSAPLPDLPVKSAAAANPRKTMSAAEQKQAIDAMIAKREAQGQTQDQSK